MNFQNANAFIAVEKLKLIYVFEKWLFLNFYEKNAFSLPSQTKNFLDTPISIGILLEIE
jgi:hypothetical protein